MEALGALLWALVIQPPQLPPALIGREYSGGPLFAAAPVCAPHGTVWSLAGGQLPPGLTLNPSGTLTGSASEAGAWRFLVRADAGCGAMDKFYVLDVLPAPVLKVLPTELKLSATLGRAAQKLALRVAGNQPGLAYSVQTDGSPWLAVRQRAGALPAAGADLVEVSVDAARLLPGESRAVLRISCWRGADEVRVPVVVDVAAPPPEAVRSPVGTRLQLPLAIPPLPLVRMALAGRPQLAAAPPPLTPAERRIVESRVAVRTPSPRPTRRMRRFAASRPQASPVMAHPPPVRPSPPTQKPKPSPVAGKAGQKTSHH